MRIVDGQPASEILETLASAPRLAKAMGDSRQSILTMLLLAAPTGSLDLSWFRREIVSNAFQADSKLLFTLSSHLDRADRVLLATSFCASALDVESFVRLIKLTRRSCRPRRRERERIAQAISRFASLHRNLQPRPFAALASGLLRSRSRVFRARSPGPAGKATNTCAATRSSLRNGSVRNVRGLMVNPLAPTGAGGTIPPRCRLLPQKPPVPSASTATARTTSGSRSPCRPQQR